MLLYYGQNNGGGGVRKYDGIWSVMCCREKEGLRSVLLCADDLVLQKRQESGCVVQRLRLVTLNHSSYAMTVF